MEKRELYDFCKRLMALPFLPARNIPFVFRRMDQEPCCPQIRQLLEYVASQWIYSNVFPVECWTVFERSFRTNNDVEGWHHKLNEAARGAGLNLYVLIQLLYDEARDVVYTCEQVQNDEIKRRRRKVYVDLHEKILALWQQFNAGEITAQQLLKQCSYLNGPIVRRQVEAAE